MPAFRAALLAAAVAFACAPVAHADAPLSFPDAESAARAAEQVAMAETKGCREFAGVILRSAAGYTYTAPVRGDREDFTLHVRLHVGESLAALYHTHPVCLRDNADTRLFSPQDVRQAWVLRVPSYIGVMADHTIRRFDPSHDSTEAVSYPATDRIARGSIVSTEEKP